MGKQDAKEILTYTTVLHQARKALELSLNEYAVADSIYHLSRNPNSVVPGWCSCTKKYLASFLGFSEGSINNIINKLVKKDLVEKEEQLCYVRTTNLWYETVIKPRISITPVFYSEKEEEGEEQTAGLGQRIFNFWNAVQPPIMKHKVFSEEAKKAVKKALKSHSAEDIEKAIQVYALVLEGKQYFWSHKWSLFEFVSRGLEKFVDKSPEDFLKGGRKSTNQGVIKL